MTGIIEEIAWYLAEELFWTEAAFTLFEYEAAIAFVVEAVALNALSQKPKLPGYLVEQSERHHVVRSSIQAHRIILGECISSGPLIGAFAIEGPTGKENEILYIAVALAGHQVKSIGTVLLNDVPSTDIKFGGTNVDRWDGIHARHRGGWDRGVG